MPPKAVVSDEFQLIEVRLMNPRREDEGGTYAGIAGLLSKGFGTQLPRPQRYLRWEGSRRKGRNAVCTTCVC